MMRAEQLAKINVHLRLTAEALGLRSVLAKLDTLERTSIATKSAFARVLTTYRQLATDLGQGKPAAERHALLADIVQLEAPQRCYEDILAERRARKVDPLDDLDNEDDTPEDGEEEERSGVCACSSGRDGAPCGNCLAGNHKRCEERDEGCDADDSDEWKARHPEDLGDGDEELRALAVRERERIFERTGWNPQSATTEDLMNFLRLERLDRKIRRDANTRTFMSGVARLQRDGATVDLFDYLEE
jgi:hypothetical protein